MAFLHSFHALSSFGFSDSTKDRGERESKKEIKRNIETNRFRCVFQKVNETIFLILRNFLTIDLLKGFPLLSVSSTFVRTLHSFKAFRSLSRIVNSLEEANNDKVQ